MREQEGEGDKVVEREIDGEGVGERGRQREGEREKNWFKLKLQIFSSSILRHPQNAFINFFLRLEIQLMPTWGSSSLACARWVVTLSVLLSLTKLEEKLCSTSQVLSFVSHKLC